MSKTTQQELFDISLQHIRKQGKPSVNIRHRDLGRPEISCVYRSEDGCGCAAAPFIVDYTPTLENNSISNLAGSRPQHVDPRALANIELVTQLQQAHDNTAIDEISATISDVFLEDYEHRMKWIAEKYGLTYAPPEQTAV